MTKVSGNGNLDPREKQLKSIEINKGALMLANSLFQTVERETGAVGKKLFTRILLQVRNYEIVGVLKAMEEISGHSLVHKILDETMSSDKDMREALVGEGNGQQTIRGVFTILLDKAEECGVDKDSIAEYKKAFIDELDVQLSGLTMFFNTKKLDKIISTVIQDIENNVHATDVERTIIEQTPKSNLQNNTISILQERFDKAQDNFELQMLEDGIFGDIADGFSKIYGSENTADKVRKDLEIASEQLNRLASAENEEEFKATFLDIYKVAYNPINVKAYKDAEAIYATALEAKKSQDVYEKEFNLLLSDKPLLEEFSSVNSSTVGAGTSFRTATKEQVYEREFNKLAEVLGENGKAILENAVKDETTLEAKYNALKSYAKGFQGYMEMLTRQACGGTDFETVERRYENSYKAAFGLDNDVLKRVNDYNLSQIQGAGIAKIATVMAAMTAISIATMGTGTAGAAATAGTVLGGMTKSAVTMATLTAGTEVLDKFTSGAALKELRQNGVLSYLEKANDMTDWGQIAKASVQAGAMTLVFMGQSYALSNLTRVAGTAAGVSAQAIAYTSAGVNAAGVVATGLGTEYLMTGEISVEGATFTVLMAVMGATIQVLQINKAINASKVDAQAQMQEKVQNARKVLGIDDGVELTEKLLREQMRKMALKYHSDKGGSDATMALINESYTFLKKLLKEGVNLNVATQTATATQAETVSNPNNLPVVSSTSARALNPSATNLVTTPITPAETAKHNATINAAGDRVLELDMFKKLSPSEIESLKNRQTFRGDADKVITLQFANGDKPAILLYDIDNDLTVLDKLKSSNIDVVHRSWEGYGGTIYHNTFVLNKEMVSDIISKNKELFQVRCGLSPEASVDDIYAHLVSKNSPLMSESNSDLIGLTLGFPQKNTFIYALENSADIDYQLRYHEDLTGYKQQLLEALNSPDCIYKDMPQSFIDDLSAQIKSIEKIQSSACVLNGEQGTPTSYQYVQFADEPSETNRIRQAIQRTANAIESGELLPPAKPDNSITGIKQQILDADSRQEFVAIRDLLKEMPPSESKTTLMQMYQQNYNEWKTQPERADVVMQYKPEDSKSVSRIDCVEFLVDNKFNLGYDDIVENIDGVVDNKALLDWLKVCKSANERFHLSEDTFDDLVMAFESVAEVPEKATIIKLALEDGDVYYMQDLEDIISNVVEADSRTASILVTIGEKLQLPLTKANIRSYSSIIGSDPNIETSLKEALALQQECGNVNGFTKRASLMILNDAIPPEAKENLIKWTKLLSHMEGDDMFLPQLTSRFDAQVLGEQDNYSDIVYLEQLLNNEELMNAMNNKEYIAHDGSILRYGQIENHSSQIIEVGAVENLVKAMPTSYHIESLLQGRQIMNRHSFFGMETGPQARKNIDIIASKSVAEINTLLDKMDDIRTKMMTEPKRYLNGKDIEPHIAKLMVDNFFEQRHTTLFALVDSLDYDAIDYLMRKRNETFGEYLDTLATFEKKDLDTLTALVKSKNVNGRAFLPQEKAEFIDLIDAYKSNNMSFDKLNLMIQQGRVDIEELNLDLFRNLMEKSGVPQEMIALMPKDKLLQWNMKYMHLVSKDVGEYDSKNYRDLFQLATLHEFKDAIHTQEPYAKLNRNTKLALEKSGANYEEWLSPSKSYEVNFVASDENQSKLITIAKNVASDIESLRKTPAKTFIDKQFPQCIKKGEFVIPDEVLVNKATLNDFVENLISQLNNIWKRAEGNLNNPTRAVSAQNTLTVLDHLKTRLKEISNVSSEKFTKSIDWTIKMWDRVPQKDLFQGNYSVCCIAQGATNGAFMPDYLLNTAYNMIEVKDNVTGNIVANALCYFAKDEAGKLVFIVDNVEVKQSVTPSDDAGYEFRDKLVEYAQNLVEGVTGQDNIPIYLGEQYNDIYFKDLPKINEELTFIGETSSDAAYMDAFGGSIVKNVEGQFIKRGDLYILKR